MTAELVTLLGDAPVGRLTRDRHGRLSFAYDTAWRQSPNAYPISLSMPFVRSVRANGRNSRRS